MRLSSPHRPAEEHVPKFHPVACNRQRGEASLGVRAIGEPSCRRRLPCSVGARPQLWRTRLTMLSHRPRLAWSTPALVAAVLGTSWACTSGSPDSQGEARVSPSIPTMSAPVISVPPTSSVSASANLSGTPPVRPTSASLTAAPTGIDSAIAVYANCTAPANQQRPTVQPREIVLACADNGFGIQDVRWSSWTATSARGSGTTWYKDCKPNCAAGKIVHTPNVEITLTTPVRGASGGLVWSRITFSTLPPGYPSGPETLPTRPD